MPNDQRIAILSDIHGNIEALNAVLNDVRAQGINRIFCLGDVVGYGPNPRECIDICFDFELCLLGNHDNGALFDPEGFSSGAERAIFGPGGNWKTGLYRPPRNAGSFYLGCLALGVRATC